MFNDPDMDGFFNHLSSYQILMDLLFKNEKFDQILDVYKSIQEKQLQIAKFPKGVMMLVFAACYKLVRWTKFMIFVSLNLNCCTNNETIW